MVPFSKAPLTSHSGGTSKGDPGLNTNENEGMPTIEFAPVTAGDKAGAAILTIFMTIATAGGAYWLII